MHACNMEKTEMEELLSKAFACTVAVSGDYPYAVPVHFLYRDGKIYIHGQNNGERASRLRQDGRVCVTVYEQYGSVAKPHPEYMCNVNTGYRSVVTLGDAAEITEETKRREIMTEITRKYRPEMMRFPISESLIARTVVFEITPLSMTGKRYHTGETHE